MRKIQWIIHCSRCGIVEKIFNGDVGEAIAKRHAGECDGSVMIGYYINAQGQPVVTDEKVTK